MSRPLLGFAQYNEVDLIQLSLSVLKNRAIFEERKKRHNTVKIQRGEQKSKKYRMTNSIKACYRHVDFFDKRTAII